MLVYNGKAKGMTLKTLLYIEYWVLVRPIEKLEARDFSKN